MKILFSVGYIEKKGNANTKIALNIARCLAKKGHTCEVIGLCNSSMPFIIKEDNLTVRGLPPIKTILHASCDFDKFLSNSSLSYENAKKTFIAKHPIKSFIMMIKYLSVYKNVFEMKRYKKYILSSLKQFCPDAIVAFYKPINLFKAFLSLNYEIPLFIYQLDPWGLHAEIDDLKRETEIKDECCGFKKAKHIFTTPVLLNQYRNHNNYIPFIDKMTGLNFPCITLPNFNNVSSPIKFNVLDINILFCGIISDDYRNPGDFLPFFQQLFLKHSNIKLYFLGTNNSAVLSEYVKKYPLNIFYKPAVPLNEAFSAMENADILLNISNSIQNQVPSKIFDYFSMGKPILNIQKIPDCPAAEYFRQFPLAFTLKTFQEIDFQAFEMFILNSKGQRLDFKEIEKTFNTATVSYVSDNVENILKRELS